MLFSRSASIPKALPPLPKTGARLNASMETQPTESSGDSRSRLAELRKRTRKGEKLTPQQAANLIKEYLLPLFKEQPKGRRLMNRSSSDLLTPIPGTLYGEIQLSSILADQVASLQQQVQLLSLQLRDSLQAQSSAVLQSQQDRTLVEGMQTRWQMAAFEMKQAVRRLQNTDLKGEEIRQELRHYKGLAEAYEEEKKELTSALRDTKSAIDIRFPVLFPFP